MTSLIKSISLKNFKGFSDEVRIELRPLTLLFGANSAGKSSVLQALHYVREILERQNINADRTLQGGEAIDLGGFQNLVNGRDSQKQIEIAVAMELGTNSIPDLVPDAFEDWQTNDEDVWWMYQTLQNIRSAVKTVAIRLRVGWNAQRELPVVQGYEIDANGEWCLKITASADGRDAQMRINHANPIFMVDGPDGDQLLSLLNDFVNPEDLGQQDSGGSEPKDTKGSPGKVSVLPSVFDMVSEAGMERPGDGLRAWLTGFRGALPRLDQLLYIPAPGARGAHNVYMVREFTAFLSWLTVGPALLLRDQLRQMRYIGPMRRIPPRGFEVSLTKSDSAWSDGMAGWETLTTCSKDLVERVSDWMQSYDKLGTGYAVERKTYQEFDPSHLVPQPIGPIRKRAQLVNDAGLVLHPQDVGVGISQVLPVVVAAQDGSASVVCIEQPELHIHPAVQVGLGDLFIDGAVNQGLSFLIETHSEHLILRLLRRIREGVEAGGKVIDQPLSPAMIGVYYLSKRNGAVKIDEIPVTTDGDFAKPWPQGFFDERGAELF
ncbi:UNVERIFIED_ORG: putative AbiEii toxin of type IV toxin-antitoxin system [Zoogloea ramigera]|uniref:AAA family ATPase n=1 Tax=Duganella zoogloeoides TaxID=75659 RepID=A0ABZ0Y080_9BURK|nr:AAA family ATPase [Duganella zoogloeoides]WQH05425.1 AAA family ATPase [Duganella zoogloeoides]